MKKIVALILSAIFMFSAVATISQASNDDIMLCHNNVATAQSNFSIINGEAIIAISYVGYPGAVTQARITTKLEKRTLLLFWSDVTEWEDVYTSEDASFEHRHTVSSGTYRVTVNFEIVGIYGTDSFESEHKESY